MSYSIPLPRLLDSQLNTVRRLHTTSCRISEGIEPLNQANLDLIHDEAVPMRALIELYTVNGSAGVYRVAQSNTRYSEGGAQQITLEHGITLLGDTVINEHKGTRTVNVTSQEKITNVLKDMYIPEDVEYTPTFESSTAEEDVPVIVQGTVSQVLTNLLNYQTSLINGVKPWVLGTCQATGNLKKELEYNNLLELINSIMDDDLPEYFLSFNMAVFPWQMNVLKRPTTIAGEGRLSRNICQFDLGYDDSNLCTRVYSERLANGYQDSPKTALYGIVGQHLNIDEDAPAETVTAIVQRHLSNYDEPKVSIILDMRDLAQITGEPFDHIRIGDRYRLAIPDYGLTMDETIISIDYDDVYGDMGGCRVTLANKTADLTWSGDKRSKNYSNSVGGAGSTATSAAATANTARSKSKINESELVKEKQMQDEYGLWTLRSGIRIRPDGTMLFASKIGDIGKQVATFEVRSDAIEANLNDSIKGVQSQITATAESLTSDYKKRIGDTADALEGKITQTAESLTSDYTDKINNTESHITQTASEIRTEVEDKENGLKSEIKQTAESLTSDYTKKIGDTESALEGKITQTAESLTSDYTDKIADTESHITQTASEIRSEVEDKENGLKSSITQNAGNITANAQRIDLIAEDYVSINRLDAEIAEIKDEYSGFISTGTIEADTGNIMSVNAVDINGLAANAITISVDGQAVATVIGEGSDVNFDRAKAAQEGANSVTLTSKGWVSGGRNVVEASNGKSYTVNLPSFSTSGGTSFSSHKTTVYFSTGSVDGPLKTVEVDATSEYNAGSKAGANGVTLSQGSWSGGKLRVSASNGKTTDVSLPSFSTSGGTSFDSNHKTTVYFSTPSVDGALKSVTVDASGQYSSGVSAGASGVTLSVGSWSGGKVTVTASNKKTATVSLPSFSVSGGDSFDSNHQTTVYFSTSSVSGALKSKTVDASGVYNAGRGQGMSEYYSSGHWAKPSSSNSWTCYVPSQYNSSAEVWFSMADILPTPSYTWTNPAKGYAQVEFYICGKYYHTAKQIPGGWM